MNYYATLFDRNYLSRGLVMMHSLNGVQKECEFFVLALDHPTQAYFEKTALSFKVNVLTTGMLESHFPELADARKNRSYLEYIFTLSPFLPLFILETKSVSRITTLDADICFYGDPAPLLNSSEEGIWITPHHFSDDLGYLAEHGRYNVSFQSFPRTADGIAVLRDWAAKCIEYCGDRLDEKGRFADQKYLDAWPESFPSIHDVPFKGMGVAPWNIKKAELIIKGENVYCSGNPIIFYHFHHFRVIDKRSFLHGLEKYRVNQPGKAVRKLYSDYWRQLKSFNLGKDMDVGRFSVPAKKLLGFPSAWLQSPFGLDTGFVVIFVDLRKFRSYLSAVKKMLFNSAKAS